MMASCLCFRSISLALTSSSMHTSEKSVAAEVRPPEGVEEKMLTRRLQFSGSHDDQFIFYYRLDCGLALNR